MDPVEKFATEAAAFEKWLVDDSEGGAAAVKACLARLLALFAAGINLPPAWSDELAGRGAIEPVDDAEWQRAYEAAQRLPLDLYGEVYDPTVVPPEEPGLGSVADDLADIYRDVVAGLRAYRHGDLAGAVWEWGFGLQSHWGAHATSAIRALYWWSREGAAGGSNDPEREVADSSRDQ